MTYDSLNRLRTRSLPGVSYSLPQSRMDYAPSYLEPYNYGRSADTLRFEYSQDGQVSLAVNKDATVRRAFHPGGALVAETLQVKYRDYSNAHSYTTIYGYDRNGRRTSLTAPPSFTGQPIGYAYHPLWGALSSVTDIAGNTFSFAYNDMSDLTGITYGGGISQAFTYDSDGRLTSDTITNGGGQVFPRWPGPKLRGFRVTNRNARGQILTSSEWVMSDQVTATYSGLGHLLTSNMQQNLQYQVGDPESYTSTDTITYDGLGNILTKKFRDSIHVDDANWQVRSDPKGYAYTTHGRVSQRSHLMPGPFGEAVTAYFYDPSGNTRFELDSAWFKNQPTDPYPTWQVSGERAAYYGPDERLLATDTRKRGELTYDRTYEEYRYDALGRRVLVRSVKDCHPPSQSAVCNAPYVRRTIWDGAQELAEIQVPVDLDNPQTEEMDTGYPIVSWEFSPADPNTYYGRVVYGPGLAVDQPLSVTRYEYRDKPGINATPLSWPRFTLQVYWNYQGLPAFGTLTTGAWAYPYQLGPTQDSCPPPGETLERCVEVQWPLMHSAYDQNRGRVPYRSWHGSLLEGKRDRSGLDYRRNRFYDPTTGRFTQEDPIGLFGGMNLYGFANGDPVNFADPFGLAADTLKEVTVQQESTEQPVQAQRTMCLDQNVSGAAQGLVNDAENLIGVTPVFNNAYRDRITPGTGGRPSGGAGSLHLSGFAFDIRTRGLTPGQLSSFTALASAYGFEAVAGDPGHYQWRGGDAPAYGSHRAAVREASRSYAAGECTDANVEAVRRGNR